MKGAEDNHWGKRSKGGRNRSGSRGKNRGGDKQFLDQVKETIAGEDREDTLIKGINADDDYEDIHENLNCYEDDFEEELFDGNNPVKKIVDEFMKRDRWCAVKKLAGYIMEADSFEMLEITGYII